jgi:hypothetical protein
VFGCAHVTQRAITVLLMCLLDVRLEYLRDILLKCHEHNSGKLRVTLADLVLVCAPQAAALLQP